MRYKDTRGNDSLIGTSADDIFLVRLGGVDNVDGGGGGGGFDKLVVDYSGIVGGPHSVNGVIVTADGTLRGTIYGPETGDQINSVKFERIDQIDYTGSEDDEVFELILNSNYSAPVIKANLGGGDDQLQIYCFGDAGGQLIEVLADGTVHTAVGIVIGVERLYLQLSPEADTVRGGAGDDIVRGLGGDDQLSGGGGNDILTGDLGTDLLTGGLGADTFAFDSVKNSQRKTIDTILDFSHAQGDRIDLSVIDADRGREHNQAFVFIDQQAFTGRGGDDGEVRQQINGDGTITLEGDRNHDGKADFSILIHADVLLVADDLRL